MKVIKIGNQSIGEGRPAFIVAEAGINHNGSIENAKRLIESAAECGADAVKFQTHLPEKEMLRQAVTAEYVGEPLFDLLKRVELSKKDHIVLKNYAEKREIIFFSTPFSVEAVDLLEDLDVPAYKVGSGEIANPPLLERVAKTGKPVILSTGMSSMEEVEEAVEIVTKYNEQLVLLQCTSTYPCPYEDVNLNVMSTLRKFGYPVGLSDHTQGIYVALAAVALGACYVEKHFTVDRGWPGPDQRASLEPSELRQLVEGARAIEKALGGFEKRVLEGEKSVRDMARESVVSVREIPKGSIITENMIWVKRPGTGIPAKYVGKVLGRRARRRIERDKLVSWEDLE
ncbi:MAG: N-acetylneuraminate synthase [Candidatus Geothermarchaeales archaeon]